MSLVSKSEEIDALVRGQREESTKLDLSSQSNKGNAINAFSKSLHELGLPSFRRVQCCSGLVLNWITRKDRVCLSGWLKPWATGIPSVSFLNCQNLALVTSNCLLFIVIYGQGNLVSFGWEAGLICLFVLLLCSILPCVWIPAQLVCEFFHQDWLSDIKNCRAFVAPSSGRDVSALDERILAGSPPNWLLPL